MDDLDEEADKDGPDQAAHLVRPVCRRIKYLEVSNLLDLAVVAKILIQDLDT